MSSESEQILDEIEELEEKLEELWNAYAEACSRKLFECDHCHRRTQIGKLTLIRNGFKVRSHGRMNDSTLTSQNDFYVHCTKCEKYTRVYQARGSNHRSFNFVVEYQDYFGEHLINFEDQPPSIEKLRKLNENEYATSS